MRFVVSGRVHGVGFRYATLRVAESVGLAGWVRNLPDGTVEVFAQGDASAIADLRRFLDVGPRTASVRSVAAAVEVPDPRLKGFRVVA